MEQVARSISWKAPEHHHEEKSANWYWALGIIAIAAAVASIILHNTLFAIVLILGAVIMMVFRYREPAILFYEVSPRGIRVEDDLYPFSNLESFYIDEDHHFGPHLFLKPSKLFGQLIIMPIPEEYLEEIESILEVRLEEEELEEPLAHQVLEFFGF